MRASEILEGRTNKVADLPPSSREALPPSLIIPDLDPNYEYYRLVVALAGMPDNNDIPLNSVVKDVPVVVPYTKQEYDMVLKMLRKMKKNETHLTNTPSGELPEIHKISPVRAFKDLD